MIKRFAQALSVVAVIVTAACGSGDNGTGVKPNPCGTTTSIVSSNFTTLAALRPPSVASASMAASDLGSMNVGDVRLLDPPDVAGGLSFPSGTSDRQYLVVVGNTGSQHDIPASYVVSANRSATSTSVSAAPTYVAPSSLAPSSNIAVERQPLQRSLQRDMDRKVRAFERKNLSLKGFRSAPGDVGATVRTSVQVAGPCGTNVGDTISLKIPNAATTNLCSNFIPTKAVVASVSRRAIIAIDTLDGNYQQVFPKAVLDSIANEFDAITYPTDSAYYNKPTDIDNNQRIVMLFSGQINKLTPANTQGGFVGGFFFAGDLFPSTGTQPGTFCPQSNRREIFYLLSPDPSGKFGNVRSAGSVRQGTRGTIAHEFQHMINAGNRFFDPAVSEFESTWLDEALAHFAEDAVGRAVRGFGDLQTLTFNDVLPCNTPCSQANDFNAFFFQNLARLTYWMEKPDQYAATMTMADTSLAVRGAAWALVRYAADNYSASDPRAFTRRLAAGPDTGVVNFAAATGASIDDVESGWLVSMYSDHQGIPGLAAKYQYKSYNFQSVMPPVAKAVLSQQDATYPLAVQVIGSGSTISTMNHSGSGTYYLLPVPAGSGTKTVRIQDGSGADANFPGEHVYVLRTQ